MRTRYKVVLGLSAIALLIFIGLTVHAVSAFARNALSIIEGQEFPNYLVCAVPFVIAADLIDKEVRRSSKKTKEKFIFSLGAIVLLVLTGLAMYNILTHVTEVAQSSNDVFTVSFASFISVLLLDMVITELRDIEYREEMVMVGLGIALLLLNAGLLGHIAWALGKGLRVGLDFKALLASSIIGAFDTFGLEVYYFGRFVYPAGNMSKRREQRQVRSEGV